MESHTPLPSPRCLYRALRLDVGRSAWSRHPPPPPPWRAGGGSDAGALVGRRVGLAALQAQGLVLEVRRLDLRDVYQRAGHRHPWEETRDAETLSRFCVDISHRAAVKQEPPKKRAFIYF